MTTQRKNKPGQGRKPLGQDRGGLVPLLVNVFEDQKEWLASLPNQQEAVRDAIDDKIKNGKNNVPAR